MGKQSLASKVREFIGGVAFGIFLWSIGMTQDEYLSVIAKEQTADE